MSERLQGWIECQNVRSLWFHDEWMPVVNLEAILNDVESIHERFPFQDTMPDATGPLRPGHGLPQNVSTLVAQEAGRWNVPYWCTYATWAALEPLRSRADLPDDWVVVIDMMASIAAYCGEEHVRLILWTYITDYG